MCGFSYMWIFFNKYVPQYYTGLSSKESACQCGRYVFDSWFGKIPWRRKWQPTPVLLPGESYGWRSLVGYGPQGLKESDTTSLSLSPLNSHFSLLQKKQQLRKDIIVFFLAFREWQLLTPQSIDSLVSMFAEQSRWAIIQGQLIFSKEEAICIS